jgi:tripartite-type tricarboxylate transporter receptor subunit TctC
VARHLLFEIPQGIAFKITGVFMKHRQVRSGWQLPALVSLLGICLLTGGAARAAFPDRPISIVVPFTAGGGTDITARLLARSMEKVSGAKVIVVNKPGAGGEIGMASVTDAPADGYTLGIVNTPNALTIPIERSAKFALSGFDLLANIVDDPGTLSVHTDSTIRSIQDLIVAARQAPDTLTYGTAGIGSAGHISMLLFQGAANVKLRHIPFKGTSDVRTALLGKQIDIATANLGEALTFARGQPWRTLGQMKAQRSPMAADIPTFAEAGYPIESGSLRGLGAPKGLPPETLASLNRIIDAAMNDPEFRDATRKAEQDILYLKGEVYATTLQGMDTQFRQLWQTSPWNP